MKEQKNWYLIVDADMKYVTAIFNEEYVVDRLLEDYSYPVTAHKFESEQQAIKLLEGNPKNDYWFEIMRRGHSYFGIPKQTEEEFRENPPQTNGQFIGAFSRSGLIERVAKYKNLEVGIEKMMAYCKEHGFDPEVDDARIFEIHKGKGSVEVYSVEIEEYMSPQS